MRTSHPGRLVLGGLCAVLTGLTLYNHIVGSKVLGFFINWLPRLFSIRYLREVHFFILFALWAFAVHHVYSAVLIGIEERSGLVGGIFSGYKFFPESTVKEHGGHEQGIKSRS